MPGRGERQSAHRFRHRLSQSLQRSDHAARADGGVPECREDFFAWYPKKYDEHFAASKSKHRDVAISAYDKADPTLRQQLDTLANSMNEILLATREVMRQDCCHGSVTATPISRCAGSSRWSRARVTSSTGPKPSNARAAGAMLRRPRSMRCWRARALSGEVETGSPIRLCATIITRRERSQTLSRPPLPGRKRGDHT